MICQSHYPVTNGTLTLQKSCIPTHSSDHRKTSAFFGQINLLYSNLDIKGRNQFHSHYNIFPELLIIDSRAIFLFELGVVSHQLSPSFHHFADSLSSCGTPVPSSYIVPKLYCALACPCSAASRYHLNASW